MSPVPLLPINTFKDSYDLFRQEHLSQLDDYYRDQCHSSTSSLQPIRKGSRICKKGGDWQEKGNIPHFSFCNKRTGDPDALSKEVKIKRKSSQTSRMEQLPLPLSQNDLSNMGLSLLSPDSRMPIGSALCRPKCCMCGAPQDWEKLRHSNQLLRDSLSDIIPSHPAIDGSMVTTTNQSSSFDEFSDVSFSGYQWNGLCNPSPPLLEVKGTKFANLSSHYVILSNRGPDDQFLGLKAQDRSAWDAYRRRLTSVHHYIETSFCTIASIREDMALIFNTFLSDLI